MTSRGQLSFALRYDFEKNALQVNICGANNLFPPNGGTDQEAGPLLDPYVKLQLLPEKQHKVKTRVVKNTANPTYDEEFTFYGINYNQLQSTTLHFAVCSSSVSALPSGKVGTLSLFVGRVVRPLFMRRDLGRGDLPLAHR